VAVLPMFPLGTVLFPGALLPLHVFEPRYRRLVEDCLLSRPEFGVVLIDRGHEVGGGDVRRDVGTVAQLLEVGQLPDGRYLLQTAGVRRIRVVEWLPDDPYPRAEVVDWEDEETGLASAAQVEDVLGRLRRVRALAAELAEPAGPIDVEIAPDPVLASYHLAALAPVGPEDDYRLLARSGPFERLALLAELLADTELVLQLRLGGGQP
jgi:Lon protease-like protein